MRSHKLCALLATAASASLSLVGAAAAQDRTWERPDAGFGQPVTEEDLALWDIAIETPTGENLPEGQGTVAEGETVYAELCMACHGEEAQGGPDLMYGGMVGGIGTMDESPRVLTPGSMYPYAPILFDYVYRAMPLDNPHSMTPDQVYAVSAYLYHLNGLIPADFVMNAETMPSIEMPNRDGFIADDRPDTANTRCMSDCGPIGTVADADAAAGAGAAGDPTEALVDETADDVEEENVGGGGTGGQVEMGTGEAEAGEPD
jgi:S-disulfanyl-L-cysteine oxidoreductase SoxD